MSKTTDIVIDHHNKVNAIIVDIDGTLAYMADRTPFQYHKAINDGVFYHIVDLVNRYRDDHEIILLTGRDEECKDVTLSWLDKHGIEFNHLFMRKRGDKRKDSIVKRELYENNVKYNYNISFVLDDRNRVVDMWREIGLICLQVAEGDF